MAPFRQLSLQVVGRRGALIAEEDAESSRNGFTMLLRKVGPYTIWTRCCAAHSCNSCERNSKPWSIQIFVGHPPFNSTIQAFNVRLRELLAEDRSGAGHSHQSIHWLVPAGPYSKTVRACLRRSASTDQAGQGVITPTALQPHTPHPPQSTPTI